MKDDPNREPADDETPMKECDACNGYGYTKKWFSFFRPICETCHGSGEVPMNDKEIEQAQLDAAISRKESLSEDLLP